MKKYILSLIILVMTTLSYGQISFNTGSTELDEDDVKLAASIILNTKFLATHVNIDEPDSDSNMEDEQFDISPSGSFPDDVDGDYGSDIEEDGDYETNPYFAFKKGSQHIGTTGDVAKVEQQVRLISNINSNDIAMEIMKMVETIKNSNTVVHNLKIFKISL